MKKMISLFLIPSYFIYGYTYFGTLGATYEIKEESIKKILHDGVKNLDKDKIRKDYLKKIEEAFTSKVLLPSSKKDETIEYIDTIEVQYDIPDPNNPGATLYEKGSFVESTLPDGMELNMCFVDASNSDVAKAIIDEFGKCDYLIANKDIREISYLNNYRVFPMGQIYIDRFKINKLPVKLTMVKNKIIKQHLNVTRIIEEIKKGDQ